MKWILAIVMMATFGAYARAPLIPVLIPAPFEEPSDRLLSVICHEETDGHPQPEWAVNQYGSAWGRCQVKYWSAVHFGQFDESARRFGIPTRSPAELFDDQVNVETAGNILDGCREMLPNATARRLAYCYHSGPGSKPYTNQEGRTYSKQVAVDFAQNLIGLAFQNRSG